MDDLGRTFDGAIRRRRPSKAAPRVQLVPKTAVDPSKLRVRVVGPDR